MNTPIVNRVAQSGIITLNLEDFYPKGNIVELDMKSYLFMELILKEKDFRKALKEQDWTHYQGQHVALICSADAIVPIWGYMLLATYLEPYAASVTFGNKDTLKIAYYEKQLAKLKLEDFHDKRVVIKGCGNLEIPKSAYITITHLLKPIVKSLMYGEPCSTVPIYKKPRPQRK